jgi:catechol 2,3-dioxygenase-like lactoylglutathione lyase family enzyme
MLGQEKFVGIIPVSDTDSVRSFYVDTLGLHVVRDTEFALVLDARGTLLRITPVPDYSPRPFSIASWQVPDVAAAVQELADHGVHCKHYGEDQDELGIWSDPSGTGKVAWFEDPAGNVLWVAGPK